jgi:hypothetical protein
MYASRQYGRYGHNGACAFLSFFSISFYRFDKSHPPSRIIFCAMLCLCHAMSCLCYLDRIPCQASSSPLFTHTHTPHVYAYAWQPLLFPKKHQTLRDPSHSRCPVSCFERDCMGNKLLVHASLASLWRGVARRVVLSWHMSNVTLE